MPPHSEYQLIRIQPQSAIALALAFTVAVAVLSAIPEGDPLLLLLLVFPSSETRKEPCTPAGESYTEETPQHSPEAPLSDSP